MTAIPPNTLDLVAGEVPYALRLPPKLKATLERWARASRRSLNAQIVVVLESAAAQAERKGDIPPERARDE